MSGPIFFRCRPYDVMEFIPWHTSFELRGLARRFMEFDGKDATPPAMAEYRDVLAGIRRLAKRVLRPRDWRRHIWRVWPNPFRRANDAELVALLNNIGQRAGPRLFEAREVASWH